MEYSETKVIEMQGRRGVTRRKGRGAAFVRETGGNRAVLRGIELLQVKGLRGKGGRRWEEGPQESQMLKRSFARNSSGNGVGGRRFFLRKPGLQLCPEAALTAWSA